MRGESVPNRSRWIGNPIGPWTDDSMKRGARVRDLARQVLSPVTADDYLPGHGDPSYDVRHYDLEIDYKLESNHLSGRARIDLVARGELQPVHAGSARPARGEGRDRGRRCRQVHDAPRQAHHHDQVRSRCGRLSSPSSSPTTAIPSHVNDSAGSAAGKSSRTAHSWPANPAVRRLGSPATTGPDNKASYRIACHDRLGLPRCREWHAHRHIARRESNHLGVRAVGADGDLPRDRPDRAVRRRSQDRVRPVPIRLVAPPGLPPARRQRWRTRQS